MSKKMVVECIETGEQFASFPLPVSVHDVAVHERENVGVTLHILERVVVHRLIKVDGVEGFDRIAIVREQKPGILEERALWVGNKIAGVELHDVGRHVVEGFARARTAHHKDI